MKNSEEIARTVFDIRDRYLENKKQKNRKAFLRFASFTAAAVCGCMTLCFGGYAVWNYVVKPIVIEEKQAETPVTTQTAMVTQTEKPTETTVTTVTSVSTTQTAAETTAKVTASEPVTEVYEEEEEYTEQPTVTTAPSKEIHLSQGYINYMNMRLTIKRINEYTEQYDIDAECYINYHSESKEEKPILLLYINDKGREEVEWYLKENNIDISKIQIEEMGIRSKVGSIHDKIWWFINTNDISCHGGGITFRRYDDMHADFEPCVFESESEEDLRALETYITYHGYDKIIPYVFKLKDPAEDATEETEADEQTAQEEDE